MRRMREAGREFFENNGEIIEREKLRIERTGFLQRNFRDVDATPEGTCTPMGSFRITPVL